MRGHLTTMLLGGLAACVTTAPDGRAEVAASYCGHLETCNPSGFKSSYGDQDKCVAIVEPTLTPASDGGACAAELDALACDAAIPASCYPFGFTAGGGK